MEMRLLFGSLFAATILSACAGQPAALSTLSPPEKLAALCQSRALTADDKAVCERNMREATAEEMPAAVKLTETRIAERMSEQRSKKWRQQGADSLYNADNNNPGYNGYTSQGAYNQAISPIPPGLIG